MRRSVFSAVYVDKGRWLALVKAANTPRVPPAALWMEEAVLEDPETTTIWRREQ